MQPRSLLSLRQQIVAQTGKPLRPDQVQLTLNDRIRLFRQTGQLLQAGLPVRSVLQVLNQDDTPPALRQVLQHLTSAVAEGRSLAAAIADCPAAFSRFQCQLVQSGEASGQLDSVLLDIAGQLEQQRELQQKLKAAARYPLGILAFAGLITMGMLWFVVPVFADLFAADEALLPAPTRILLNTADALKQFGWPVFSSAFLTACLLAPLRRHPAVHDYLVFHLLWHLPVLRMLLTRAALARIAHLMALTLHAGLPILEALNLSAQATREPRFRLALTQVQQGVRAGQSLHAALANTGHFPPLFVQLVLSGEQTGQLDRMLARAADLYTGSVRHRVERLVALLEPTIMVILALVVGGLLAALYLPVFSMGNAI